MDIIEKIPVGRVAGFRVTFPGRNRIKTEIFNGTCYTRVKMFLPEMPSFPDDFSSVKFGFRSKSV